ncbi:DUF1150 family protein [Mangrovicoccus algicola]|uniref:DUF1150 family protein n=1 Tax=Mangrovicoccus algicola TaxID=2771008 RepID=A0A8J6Z0W4_9RHOB|nr:DUF1150 family protein [Mangrovicoccus algicola]MBE3639426.1 DUF1150 family protein [Mangrovicoccus algicola]
MAEPRETRIDQIDQVPRIVYVRAVDKAALPQDLQEATADIPAPYSLHAPDGERLAIVRDQKLAFLLARQNDLTPVYVN